MKRRNFLIYSLLLTAGCTTATERNAPKASVSLPETLRFGVTDVRTLQELEQDYEPFRMALAEIFETKIEFVPINSQLAAASTLRSGQLDLAWAGPSEYVAIKARSQAVPLVSLNRPNYYTTISVRGDSGIKSLADLKGKKIDMEEVGANTAHLGGIKVLLDAGLNPKTDFQVVMSGQETIEELKQGRVDAWSTAVHIYQQALAKEGATETDYPIIARGENFPGDIFVVAGKFAPEVVEEMRSRMLANTDKLLQAIQASSLGKKFKDVSFSPSNDADYDMIREVYKAIGQDEYLQ
ncbi:MULTISPECIES: PhnD/SsuA/transferrin family substrate-binding protein [Spirulina sp. CCY15215]|uniref:PhnD/SsuA/transferrin family substrate-binding protein n=1 Tax=Spirulina sp. CCY15215 TaxID=2767591 RepID=UPI00194E4AED|nr:PhnD/SsuA/transferrin family substrate-binding protein [Spirulina major]